MTPEVSAYVRSALPPPPARVLEVGAGAGELADALRAGGYDVVAIDPAGGPGIVQVHLHELDEPDRSFDAAVAVVSLHHVEPLAESVDRLAALLAPGSRLVVDEFDVDRYDEAAARWWLGHADRTDEPAELVANLRAHLHSLTEITAALERWFDVGEPVRGAYLHRWEIDAALRGEEEAEIAAGRIPATGARFIATRASRAPAAPPPPRA
ncbi:MAG TPA: class I SAM-dependent methyltransferase [Solirubrobacteraceae bacterium]|jgi:SAM-dependent methyltransferase